MTVDVIKTVMQDPATQIFASGFLTKELIWKKKWTKEKKRTAVEMHLTQS